jgi:O-antigen/teichoic acid export membrane protein
VGQQGSDIVSNWRETLSYWRQDALLGKVVGNSLHLFSSNTLSMALVFVQGVLSARLLGAAGYGLVGLVMAYASTVNSLLSFRMGELVVRYGGEYLERGEKDKASAVFKIAMVAETIVSVLAFLFVALTAELASQYIVKTPGTGWMFVVFALGLLANFNYETSIGILQITDRIKLQGTINLVQSIVSLLIIISAFVFGGGIEIVLFAYLLGRIILGIGVFVVAQVQLRRALGAGWWKVPFSARSSYRELVRFAVSSNISATIIKIFRDSEILWVGFFLSTTAAGYYKVAYTLIMLLAAVTDPLIAAVFPEINRLVVQRAWPRLRDFLRKVTSLSFAYNAALALGLVLFGRWIILLYGEQYTAAYPALIALLVGMAFNYTLFWNRPLLLSLGLPEFPIRVTLIVGLIKVALAFPIVPRYGYVAEAALLSFYYIASVGVMAWRGLREIHDQEQKV